MPDEAQILDVTDWPEQLADTRGKRSKFWVCDPQNLQWLRKAPRESRPYEPAIEVATLELARLASIAAAEARLARWRDTRTGQECRGIIVKRFLDGDQSFSMGSDLLGGVDKKYDVTRHEQHTLARVRATLRHHEEAGSSENLCQTFVRILIFDAWIGNGDRHPENWGMIFSKKGVPSMAPIYDTAACLGTELQDRARMLQREARTDALMERYIRNCPSGFGNGQKQIKQPEALREMLAWENSREVASSLLATFGDLVQSAVPQVLSAFPESELPAPRRELAQHLLKKRLSWLTQEINDAIG